MFPEVVGPATWMENLMLQWGWTKTTFYFPKHLNIFLIYSSYLSTTTGSFFSHALFQSLSSLLFIFQHFHSEAYVWQTYAPVFARQMSESLPTIKVSYTFSRKKNILEAVVILLREKKTNDLLRIGSQYSFTKDVTRLLGGWHSSFHSHIF